MKMTTCPRCQSTNVFASVGGGGVGFDWEISLSMGNEMDNTENWETRICTDCGYFENYLTETKWLEKIKAGQFKNWRRVS